MFGFFSNLSGFQDYYRLEVEMANRMSHRAFIEQRLRRQKQIITEAKSISLLTTSVNRPKMRSHIRQPVWRAGRWKSLT